MINTAKAVLIGENIKTNTQAGIVKDFDQYFVENGLIKLDGTLGDLIYQIKSNKADAAFSRQYFAAAQNFYNLVDNLRTKALNDES